MKIRLEFEKNIRYISHLELMKAIQKILKRTGLKIKYSQGYNPHIILSVANPIPVGVCGKSEFADFELEDDVDEKILLDLLVSSSPVGLVPKNIYKECKKDFNSSYKAVYKIEVNSAETDKIKDFFNEDVIEVEKKAKGKIKIINIKEYIYSYSFEENCSGFFINCELACGTAKNLNPNLIKKALEEKNIDIKAFLPVRFDVLDENNEDFRK